MKRKWARVCGVLAGLLLLSAGAWAMLRTPTPAMASGLTMMVYRSPSCGCCDAWEAHVREAGFQVMVHEVSQEGLGRKSEAYGVPARFESCHIAEIGDYLVVGHVPAEAIRRMLLDEPAIAGVAVPGMPVGASSMERGMGQESDPVLAFTEDGRTSVFAER